MQESLNAELSTLEQVSSITRVVVRLLVAVCPVAADQPNHSVAMSSSPAQWCSYACCTAVSDSPRKAIVRMHVACRVSGLNTAGLPACVAVLNLQGLQRRKDAAAARATLELMQEVAASTGKVEKLLSELASGQQAAAGAAAAASTTSAGAGPASEGGAGGDELEERCRMLLRVAGEAARLMFLAERGKVSGQRLLRFMRQTHLNGVCILQSFIQADRAVTMPLLVR